MSLPVVKMPTAVVKIADLDVEVRGLTRAQALRIVTFKDDPDGAEAFVLACGAGVSEAEAQAWRESTPSDDVGLLVDKILEISGLTEGAQKSV